MMVDGKEDRLYIYDSYNKEEILYGGAMGGGMNNACQTPVSELTERFVSLLMKDYHYVLTNTSEKYPSSHSGFGHDIGVYLNDALKEREVLRRLIQS